MSSSSSFPGLSTRRIEAFSDGVFSIVITLMAFQIKLPPIDSANAAQELPRALITLWPEFYTYALSFLMVGVYWIGHHNAYHHIQRSNRPLLWMNLVSLMIIALLPFSASVLGRYMDNQISVVLYGSNIIAIGLANYAQWRYALNARLVNAEIEPWFVKKVNFRMLMAPAVAVSSILVSFINTRASVLLYLALIVFYMFPTALDRFRK